MIDAFISYSRTNIEFIQALANTLERQNKQVWFDQKREPLEGIPHGSKWWDEIQYGIKNAANLLYVITPQSIVSPYCNAEIACALKEEKRIVTVMYCQDQSVQDTLEAINTAIDLVDPTIEIPDVVTADLENLRSLTRRNWLEISQIQFVIARSIDPIERVAQQVSDAIDLDIQWLRLWNDFRQAVQLWSEKDKDDAYLWSEKRLKVVRTLAEERAKVLSEIQREFALPEAERLLLELEDIDTSHDRRLTIGIRLSEIGDPRPGVGVKDGVPHMVWCAVNGGQIAIEDKTFAVKPFYIAKYLITYRQFQAFLEADDGFEREQWWKDLPEQHWKQEMYEQYQRYGNYPRDSVSWYQAVAFSRWLNHQLQQQTFTPENTPGTTFTVGDSLIVRLPTEWEWQQVAIGDNPANEYPWGDWDDRLANTGEAGLGRPTAVGMYANGQADCGALDIAGNMYEWCLNDHGDLSVKMDCEESKTLRGGSFDWDRNSATCVHRHAYSPEDWFENRGFRVVCAPLF